MINLDTNHLKILNKKYGDSFYLFEKKEFVDNYNELVSSFRKYYSNYQLCYSYKTNYTPAICKIVKSLGGYAEVVSDMEYWLALKVGYSADKIVFNGPCKGDYLNYHIKNNGFNNADNFEELYRISKIAKGNPNRIIKTGIRVNLDIIDGFTSRFGFDIKQIPEVLDFLKKNNILLDGIHCHISRARGLNEWIKRANIMLGIIKDYNLNNIRYISLGSGMYGKMDDSLLKQFPSNIPSYDDYAKSVLKIFDDYYKNSNIKPFLFTEPGTTIISKYFDFATKVNHFKEISGKTFVVVDGSIHNLGETAQMKKLPVNVINIGRPKKDICDSAIVGYTCLEQDVLYSSFSGHISVGDFVIFGNVGGYSIVDKPPFIKPNVPIIMIDDDKYVLIKEKETFEDIFRTYVF